MEQQIPQTPVLGSPQQEGEAPNFVWMGVIIGLIIALIAVGGIYYKMKIDLLSAQSKQKVVPTIVPTSEPKESSFFGGTADATASPTVTPVTIQSPQDLTKQNIVLDDMDLSSLSAELEKNTAASVDFTQ